MKKISSIISLSFLIIFLLLFVNPVNVYSESVESGTIIEPPKVEPTIPDSKEWKSIIPLHYYNKKTLTKSSNIVSVWTYRIITDEQRKKEIEIVKKDDLEKSIKYQNYEDQVTLWKVDCKNRYYKMEKSIDYDHTGIVLESITVKNNEWNSIPPDTLIEGLYNKICVTPKKPSKKK